MNNKKNVFAIIILCVFALVGLMPFLWVIFSAFKSEAEIQTIGFKFFPQTWTFENFIDIFSDVNGLPIVRWFLNSLVVSFLYTSLTLILSSLSAFALARLSFKGRDTIFTILMVSLMFPAVVNLIPVYKIVQELGWLETPFGAIAPGLGGALNIFLIRQFMKGIPLEIDEAAKMDGANSFQIYVMILSLIKPVLIVVGLFSFVASWNDFLWPTLVFNEVEHMTLAVGLLLAQGVYDIEIAHSITMALLSIVPTIGLYFIAQKYFLSGISLSSGTKG